MTKLVAAVHLAKEGVLLFMKCRFLSEVNLPIVMVSSVWCSIRLIYISYCRLAFWLIRNGIDTSYWHDNWLGMTLSDWLQISRSKCRLLRGSIMNFFHDRV